MNTSVAEGLRRDAPHPAILRRSHLDKIQRVQFVGKIIRRRAGVRGDRRIKIRNAPDVFNADVADAPGPRVSLDGCATVLFLNGAGQRRVQHDAAAFDARDEAFTRHVETSRRPRGRHQIHADVVNPVRRAGARDHHPTADGETVRAVHLKTACPNWNVDVRDVARRATGRGRTRTGDADERRVIGGNIGSRSRTGGAQNGSICAIACTAQNDAAAGDADGIGNDVSSRIQKNRAAKTIRQRQGADVVDGGLNHRPVVPGDGRKICLHRHVRNGNRSIRIAYRSVIKDAITERVRLIKQTTARSGINPNTQVGGGHADIRQQENRADEKEINSRPQKTMRSLAHASVERGFKRTLIFGAPKLSTHIREMKTPFSATTDAASVQKNPAKAGPG